MNARGLPPAAYQVLCWCPIQSWLWGGGGRGTPSSPGKGVPHPFLVGVHPSSPWQEAYPSLSWPGVYPSVPLPHPNLVPDLDRRGYSLSHLHPEPYLDGIPPGKGAGTRGNIMGWRFMGWIQVPPCGQTHTFWNSIFLVLRMRVVNMHSRIFRREPKHYISLYLKRSSHKNHPYQGHSFV